MTFPYTWCIFHSVMHSLTHLCRTSKDNIIVLLQFRSQYRLNPEWAFGHYHNLRSLTVRRINKHFRQVTLQYKRTTSESYLEETSPLQMPRQWLGPALAVHHQMEDQDECSPCFYRCCTWHSNSPIWKNQSVGYSKHYKYFDHLRPGKGSQFI